MREERGGEDGGAAAIVAREVGLLPLQDLVECARLLCRGGTPWLIAEREALGRPGAPWLRTSSARPASYSPVLPTSTLSLWEFTPAQMQG